MCVCVWGGGQLCYLFHADFQNISHFHRSANFAGKKKNKHFTMQTNKPNEREAFLLK